MCLLINYKAILSGLRLLGSFICILVIEFAYGQIKHPTTPSYNHPSRKENVVTRQHPMILHQQLINDYNNASHRNIELQLIKTCICFYS